MSEPTKIHDGNATAERALLSRIAQEGHVAYEKACECGLRDIHFSSDCLSLWNLCKSIADGGGKVDYTEVGMRAHTLGAEYIELWDSLYATNPGITDIADICRAIMEPTIRAEIAERLNDARRVVSDFNYSLHDWRELQLAPLVELASRVNRSEKKRFTVWGLDDILSWERPKDDVIMGDGHICRETLTTVIGPPGVGKSRAVLNMALHNIIGRSWGPLQCKTPHLKWLVMGNENSKARFKADLRAMSAAVTDEEREHLRQLLRFHVLENPEDGIIAIDDIDARERFRNTLQQEQPDVVTLDPWANLVAGDENKNEDVRNTVRMLLQLIRSVVPRAAVVVIAHARTGKGTVGEAGNRFSGGSLARGGKALVSAARCEIGIWPGDKEDFRRIVVTCEKANDAPIFEAMGLRCDDNSKHYVHDENFDPQEWKDDVEGKRTGQTVSIADVVEYFETCGKPVGTVLKMSEICDGLMARFDDVSKKTIQRRVKAAVEKGYLAQADTKGGYTKGKKMLHR